MIDPDNLDKYEIPGRKRKVGLTYNSKEKRFVLTFDKDVSKTELLEEWDRFESARKKLTGKSYHRKTTPPTDVSLLLGVQFLRLYGITFKLIHQAYRDKQVPHYSGNYHFLTEFDLQKYYDRNIKKI